MVQKIQRTTIGKMNVNKLKQIKLSVLLDKLTELGWDYTAGRMARSGMQGYDEIMQYVGVLDSDEHWNEDVYECNNCDH